MDNNMEINIVEQIKKEFKDFQERKLQLTEQLRNEFPKLIQPLLSQSKIIENICWIQYTCYFNDGDTCYFSRYDFGVNNKPFEIPNELKEKVWDGRQLVLNPKRNIEEINLWNQIISVLENIPNETYKDLFGDHKQVTVYKDGRIVIDDYEDHD